ncbi:uncharacterized protein F4817DRAFT_29579 [Daldinia loculata]|uniref:uncharacterized protein n=1 Tax=Daldinia loculata TaxID=103429 RepID=UPI0020C4022B|nr:uncharacterized protein F4817DRAFT_29579 [Daldinia loculata]KAI1641838.1 hypothetical protein F4817DRAFT_29579 [Daldinia loculata]
MARSDRHGLVFGGTGLIGWGVVNELLSGYPEQGVFNRVTAVTNRSLKSEDTYWPEALPGLPELQICSGVDLLNGTGEDLAATLEKRVPDIQGVTHVFYFVFTSFSNDFEQECALNCGIMRKVAKAVNMLCPSLQSFVYSGGTRGYGIYDPNINFETPLEEHMASQLPEDYAKIVAYPWFREILTEAAKGRGWTWTEVCPDIVVGFSPIGSGYSLALHWAQYLSLYAFNHGISDSNAEKRVEISFPGTEAGFDARFTQVSTRILGRISIFASLNPDRLGGQIINALDDPTPTTFRELWPEIAGWFGLVGVGPSGNEDSSLTPSEYIAKHKHLFEEHERPKGVTAGVGAGSKQLDTVGYWLSFDRELSANKLRSTGFLEQQLPAHSWMEAFRRLRLAGVIF